MVVRSVQRLRRGATLALGLAVSPACSPVATSPPAAPLVVPPLDAAAGGDESQPGGVRFGHAATRVGARFRIAVESHGKSNAPGNVSPSALRSSWAVEVLAMDGPGISRARLSFDKCTFTSTQGIEEERAVSGKTFIIDVTAPFVRDERGAPADESDTTAVLNVFPDLGTRTHVDQLMPDAPMAIGDARHELASAVMRVMHPKAWTLNRPANTTAVLARVEGEEAVFAVTLDAKSESFRINLAGEVKVRLRDVRLSSIALEGSYELVQGGRGAGQADGTFSYRRTVTDL